MHKRYKSPPCANLHHLIGFESDGGGHDGEATVALGVPIRRAVAGVRGRAERGPRVAAEGGEAVRATTRGGERLGGGREQVQVVYHHQIDPPILHRLLVAIDANVLQADWILHHTEGLHSKQQSSCTAEQGLASWLPRARTGTS